MLSNTVSKNASLLQAALKPMTLLQAPVRGYMPYYQKKNDDYFKPRYFDNVRR
jgi:hypothetical protein